ncbi:hypothetical protein [Lysobacter sp. CA199]|uniref:hypothetical protein n=1 Tax=Lysobacter sp. CA199 TaxID=3455608 RepID=UPI003F8D1C76
MDEALRFAVGKLSWLAVTAAMVLLLAPGVLLLRARVAAAVGARPAFGAVLWSIVFALIVWLIGIQIVLIAASGTALGSGPGFVATMPPLSWLALSLGVRLYLPGPDGVKLAWSRALRAALPAVLLAWAEGALVAWMLKRYVDLAIGSSGGEL